MKRRTYYAHISGAGWIKEIIPTAVICTTHFDGAMPFLSGALTELPEIVAAQYHGYRLRILKVEHDQVTPNG